MSIARIRLASQRLSTTEFTTPAEVVSWLGAVQAQEFPGAKWSVGQRMKRSTDAGVEAAFASGSIIRTHLLRPTWHFVAAPDLRWMLALSGPRVQATVASYYRRFELDAALLRKTRALLARTLAGRHVTRDAIRTAFTRSRIPTDTIRLGFILLDAELLGMICSGPRAGRQFTYALLDERVPAARAIPRDEALAMLTRRYFVSRGPATLRDFCWWSSLTVKDARRGVDMLGRELAERDIDGDRYWAAASPRPVARATGKAYLLPLYDEFLIAYKDRSASAGAARPGTTPPMTWSAPLMVDGRVVGSWRQSRARGETIVSPTIVTPAVETAVRRYAAFLGTHVRCT